MSFYSGNDNSYEENDSQDADFCPWMQPLLMNAKTNTCFPNPISNQRENTTQKSVRVLAHPRTKDGSVKKSCNFVYTPGTLFNRRIICE